MQKNNSLTIAIRNALVCALAPTAVVAFTAQAQEDVVQDDVIAMETITVTAQALKVKPRQQKRRAAYLSFLKMNFVFVHRKS